MISKKALRRSRTRHHYFLFVAAGWMTTASSSILEAFARALITLFSSVIKQIGKIGGIVLIY